MSQKIIVLLIGLSVFVWGYSAWSQDLWSEKPASEAKGESSSNEKVPGQNQALRKIVDYQVVTERIPHEKNAIQRCATNKSFAKKVKNLLSKGWQPLGGHTIQFHSGNTSGVMIYYQCVASQTMVKYE